MEGGSRRGLLGLGRYSRKLNKRIRLMIGPMVCVCGQRCQGCMRALRTAVVTERSFKVVAMTSLVLKWLTMRLLVRTMDGMGTFRSFHT